MLNISSYDVKKSKSGHLVPVINDIHLHSIYNPIREAESFIESQKSDIEKNTKFLVLGLGFGYHIDALKSLLKDRGSYTIYVVEPCQKTVETYKEGCRNPEITILSGFSIQNYFKNEKFIDFLTAKPLIISHPASFNLFNDFFKSFFQYSASNKMGDINEFIRDQDLKSYLERCLPEETVKTLARKIRDKKKISNELDFLILMANQITTSNEVVSNE